MVFSDIISPVFTTSIITIPSARDETFTLMSPPFGVYFAAFESRLYTILSTLSVSYQPSIWSGELVKERFWALPAIRGLKASTQEDMNFVRFPLETDSFRFPLSTFLNSSIC